MAREARGYTKPIADSNNAVTSFAWHRRASGTIMCSILQRNRRTHSLSLSLSLSLSISFEKESCAPALSRFTLLW